MSTATLTNSRDAHAQLGERRRVVQLDFVRGIAILLVIQYHAMTLGNTPAWTRGFWDVGKRIGWMGVDLFFVLSGFLVGGLLVQELTKSGTIRVKRFLVRRMLKIWPAYYVYVLFQIVIRRHPLNTFWWQNGLNIQNYAGTSLNHTWSLAVEEHFYLLLPILLLGIYRNRFARVRMISILGTICALVLVVRTVTYPLLGAARIQWETHTRVDSLFFGVLLSYVFYTSRERFDRYLNKRGLLIFLSILVFVIAMFSGGYQSAYTATVGYTVNYLCFGALMLLIYGYEGYLIRTFFYRAIARIGRYSYGIYLWHLSVREFAARLCSHLPASIGWIALLVFQYAAAIVLGILVTEIVEFPVLRVRDRLFPRGV